MERDVSFRLAGDVNDFRRMIMIIIRGSPGFRFFSADAIIARRRVRAIIGMRFGGGRGGQLLLIGACRDSLGRVNFLSTWIAFHPIKTTT